MAPRLSRTAKPGVSECRTGHSRRHTFANAVIAASRPAAYSSKLEKARAAFLAKHRFATCKEHGVRDSGLFLITSNLHRGDAGLFWTQSNWERCVNQATTERPGSGGSQKSQLSGRGPCGYLARTSAEFRKLFLSSHACLRRRPFRSSICLELHGSFRWRKASRGQPREGPPAAHRENKVYTVNTQVNRLTRLTPLDSAGCVCDMCPFSGSDSYVQFDRAILRSTTERHSQPSLRAVRLRNSMAP